MHAFKSITLLTAVLMTHTTHAALITDYHLDAFNNIVTDTDRGIEWLQWDVTDGMRINQALTAHSADGWGLASNVQVAALFNDFDLSYGAFVWDGDEQTDQYYRDPSDGSTESLGDRELVFVDLFGDTYDEIDNAQCAAEDCIQYASAFFGNDGDSDGFYNRAEVYDDYEFGAAWQVQSHDGYAWMESDAFVPYGARSNAGVALVRVTRSGDGAVAVHEPTTIALLGLALLGVLRTRRIQK